jgi:hypothetical protein
MSLRLRRGTDAQRLSITFQEGELVYTTDTKELYVGDGTTPGGILVSQTEGTPGSYLVSVVDDTSPELGGSLNLNNFDINGTGDINITGSITSTVVNSGLFVGDGSGLTNLPAGGIVPGDDYNINIVGNDSTIIVNAATNTFNGTFIGDGSGLTNLPVGGIVPGLDYNINIVGSDSSRIVDAETNTFTGAFIGSLSGTVNGDVQGSVFADNSSLIVDGQSGNIYTTALISDSQLDLNLDGNIFYNRNGLPVLYLNNDQPAADLSTGSTLHGLLVFRTTDVNGVNSTALFGAAANGFSINKSDETYALPNSHKLFIGTNGNFGFGTITPTEKFDFGGNVAVRGNLVTNGFISGDLIGSVFADDSTTLIDSIAGIINGSAISGIIPDASISESAVAQYLGSFTFSGNTLDTDDSGAISVTPATVFNSDVTVENNLVVTNKIIATTLEVENIITNASGTPELQSDTDIVLNAGTRVEISNSPFKFASFTTVERNALSPQNGDVIYNTTDSKFQGYAGGTWVNLH